MAGGVVRLSDVIVPEVFTPYTQVITEEKSRIIASGALEPSAELSQLLQGGGLTFHQPFFKDLDNDEENVSNDDPTDLSTPNKLGTAQEIQVRLNRNNSWSSMNLVNELINEDPMMAIANRVGAYWSRRLQLAFVATMNGMFAQNATATNGNHVQDDMTHDISGTSFVDGVTNFSAEAFIDTSLTMGDSMEDLSLVLMHSVVYGRLQKNNLIDFIPDSRGEIMIATFLGREVVVDDGMPNAGGVFQTWLFARGASRFGSAAPKVPTEVERKPDAGNGGGQDVLYNRVQWVIHPVGHAYVGTPPMGGPSNAATANNLGAAASWQRVFPERKQIKIARLITREY